MIVAAAAAQPPQLPINWFDGVVAIVIAFGLYRGRRNGMARELLPLLQWFSIVLVCGFGYTMVGQIFMNFMGLQKATAYVTAYLIMMFLLLMIFIALRRHLTEKLVQGNYFHNSEYYLGMISGPLRCACVLIVLLALLNAPFYSQNEIQAHDAYIKKTYGGGLYGGDYFPTLQEIQEQVFTKSFTGPFGKKYLALLLIQTNSGTPPAKPK